MQTFLPDNHQKLLNIQQVAVMLSVPVETLLLWNDHNILKPTITLSGEVGYGEEQINQFLAIQKRFSASEVPVATSVIRRPFSVVPFLSVSTLVTTLTVLVLTQSVRLLPGKSTSSLAEATTLAPIRPETTVAQTGNNLGAGNVFGYAQTTNFAPEVAVLAADSMRVVQTVDPKILFALVPLGLLPLAFVIKKPSKKMLSDAPTSYQEQKVFEVNQKADGAVVLSFQGQEYKVSKPELDSESDQLIERLMELATPDVKEIDYATFEDGKISLSTPLSRLVTRLGFVGIKRDLFFPRTSKNRVLFRRYLTQTDLTAMNLTPSQISSDLFNSN